MGSQHLEFQIPHVYIKPIPRRTMCFWFQLVILDFRGKGFHSRVTQLEIQLGFCCRRLKKKIMWIVFQIKDLAVGVPI